MKFVATRAGKVAYETRGSGVPLLLLSSNGHDHRDFDAVVPVLSQRCQTIAVDWPGHGGSESFDPPSSASVGEMCGALEDLVETLALPPVILLGNSVGGTASIRFAGRYPERVRGLIPVDTGGLAEQGRLLRFLCWVQGREAVRRHTGMAFARSYMKRRNPQVAAALGRLAAAHARPGGVEVDAAMWRSFGTPDNDVSAEAGAVRCPTLLVWGRHDPVLPARTEGQRARRLLPGADYRELDTGHVPFVEDPAAFLEAVLPFLDSLLARPEGLAAAPRRNA